MTRVVLTVPCFDEERRLDAEAFVGLAQHPGIELLLVDDGSRDRTRERLVAIRDRVPSKVRVLPLARNGGKAEAVRRGLEHALAGGAGWVGYVDADLATPPDEIERLAAELEHTRAAVLLGSRVRLLGRDIQRRAARHYLGRVFATCASLALDLPVYDTQCGAKLFRRTRALERAVREPFRSRWAFDVELLGRLLTGADALSAADLVEVPLAKWADVDGSKIRVKDALRMGTDLAGIAWELRRRRKGPPS